MNRVLAALVLLQVLAIPSGITVACAWPERQIHGPYQVLPSEKHCTGMQGGRAPVKAHRAMIDRRCRQALGSCRTRARCSGSGPSEFRRCEVQCTNEIAVRWTAIKKTGAGKESRTLDLNLGKVALYQLSYSRVSEPMIICRKSAPPRASPVGPLQQGGGARASGLSIALNDQWHGALIPTLSPEGEGARSACFIRPPVPS